MQAPCAACLGLSWNHARVAHSNEHVKCCYDLIEYLQGILVGLPLVMCILWAHTKHGGAGQVRVRAVRGAKLHAARGRAAKHAHLCMCSHMLRIAIFSDSQMGSAWHVANLCATCAAHAA